MSGYFLLSTLRNLWRNKLHSLINIASLMIGLTVFSFAFLYTKHELSYDQFPDSERVHRVVMERKGLSGLTDGEFDFVPPQAYTSLVQYFDAEIDKVSMQYDVTVIPKDAVNERIFSVVAAVDATFADIFQLDVVSGSLKAVLQSPGFIALDESALTLFSEPVAVGSRITLMGAVVGEAPEVEYEVGAIYRMPETTSTPVQFRMITLMHDYSLRLQPGQATNAGWNSSVSAWLTFKPAVDVERLNASLPNYVDSSATTYKDLLKPGERVSDHLGYRFQSLADLHFNPVGDEESSMRGDKAQMLTIAAVGVLVLLVGCSNSISLSLASAMERRRDIGIHKTLGALQRDILFQWLGQTVLLSLLALLPALVLVEWLLPAFKTLLRLPRELDASARDFALLTGIAVMTGLASGAYPALVLAGVRPKVVLKSGGDGSLRGNNKFRSTLVGFQFCFAVILMITTLALFLQLNVVRNQPLGFSVDNLVLLYPPFQQSQGRNTLMQELGVIPGVVAATSMGNPPNANTPLTINTFNFNRGSGDLADVSIQFSTLGAQAFDMLGIPLLAGRSFDPLRDEIDPGTGLAAEQAADAPPEYRMIFTRAAVRALGFDSPEAAAGQYVFTRRVDRDGKMVETAVRIIGVVEDNMLASLRRRAGPGAYMFGSSGPILLKYEDNVATTVQQDLQRVVQDVTGSPSPFVIFLETQLAAEFAVENNQGRILLYCAGLALLLSCIGLFGLASFTMQRNVKEVGVRRVMGASVTSVTALYLWRYAKPVVMASVLACPVAVHFVLQWLQRFPYQLERQWLLPLCLVASGTVLFIAMCTVASVVINTAQARPVESLRYE